MTVCRKAALSARGIRYSIKGYIYTNNSPSKTSIPTVLIWRSMWPPRPQLRTSIPSTFWRFCAEKVSRFLSSHPRFFKHFISGQFDCASWLDWYGIGTIVRTYMQMQIQSHARPEQVPRIITGQSALRRRHRRDSIRLTNHLSWWDMNTVSPVPLSFIGVCLLKIGGRRILNDMIKYHYQLPKYRYRPCSRIRCSPTRVQYRGGLAYLLSDLPDRHT